MFSGKTFLITGGTGSFGKTVVRHLLTTDCGEIRILSRDEAKQDDMRHALPDPRLRFYIGDVRDAGSVRGAMQGVDFVFHAAALKQVPSCEDFPEQAVFTNVLGSKNVIDAAVDAGVKRLVAISTDKAVYPINAMGMSKAMMEKLVRSKARAVGADGPILASVRYGNVVYSRGSVAPLFADQIKRGGPLTVTVPGMTRFLLTLADAIELIEFALLNANQGDMFIRKSPASTVANIAAAMRELYEVGDLPIKTIGIRPGEKIHETLATMGELSVAEDMGRYYRIGIHAQAMSSDVSGDISALQDYTSAVTEQLDVEGSKALLLRVPEIRVALDEWRKLKAQ